MIRAIPTKTNNYSRIWDFEGDTKDTRNQFVFTLIPKLGGGGSSYIDGSLVTSNYEIKVSFEHGDMDIFEKESFCTKLRLKTEISGAVNKYSVLCEGDTGFSFVHSDDTFQFKLWDSQGLIVNTNQGFITNIS